LAVFVAQTVCAVRLWQCRPNDDNTANLVTLVFSALAQCLGVMVLLYLAARMVLAKTLDNMWRQWRRDATVSTFWDSESQSASGKKDPRRVVSEGDKPKTV
jgi:hypothetical protein